jgi:hypothetical protein
LSVGNTYAEAVEIRVAADLTLAEFEQAIPDRRLGGRNGLRASPPEPFHEPRFHAALQHHRRTNGRAFQP